MQNHGEHVLNKQEGIVFKSINQIVVNLTLEFGGFQMSDTTDKKIIIMFICCR